MKIRLAILICLSAFVATNLENNTNGAEGGDGQRSVALALAQTKENDNSTAIGQAKNNRADRRSRAGEAAKAQTEPAPDNRRATSQNQRAINSQGDNETKVMVFVEKHQPQLAKLLTVLKRKSPAQYGQAIKEAARSQQRLDGLAERDSELFDVELNLWKVRTQLRLRAAEAAIKKSNEQDVTEKLTALLVKENELDQQRVGLMRKRLQRQLTQLDQRLQQLEQEKDSAIAKSLKSWEARIKKQIQNH